MLVFILLTIYIHPYAATQVIEKNVFTSKSDFLRVAKYPAFVDKTMFIKTIFLGRKQKVITAPRKFGKSTNLDMLRTFLSVKVDSNGKHDNKSFDEIRNVFKNLKIYKQEQMFFDDNYGQHPVLYIDLTMTSFLCSNNHTVHILMKRIHESYKQHQYICKSPKLKKKERSGCEKWCHDDDYEDMHRLTVKPSLKRLSMYMYKYYGDRKIVVLVDGYDDMITKMYSESDTGLNNIKYKIGIIMNTLNILLQGNPYILRAVITGTSHIVGYKFLEQKMIIHKFLYTNTMSQYFGFKKYEVIKLYKKFNVSKQMAVAANNWYEGYCSSQNFPIYCPFSILNFLQDRKIENYWKNSGRVLGLETFLRFPHFEKKISDMLRYECVEAEVLSNFTYRQINKLRSFFLEKKLAFLETSHINIYFTYLYEQGYISFNPKKKKCLKIPNKEIEQEFSTKIREHYFEQHKLVGEEMRKCASFFNNVVSMTNGSDALLSEMKNFNGALQVLFKQYKIHFNTTIKNKLILAQVMFVMMNYATGFVCKRKLRYHYKDKNLIRRESLIELLMYKENFGIIIELSHRQNKDANSKILISKILKRKYHEIFKTMTYKGQYIERYFLIGVSVNKKRNISTSCLINSKQLINVVTIPRITP